MAITGSGSLAIFLSVSVISAAFLLKGKFLCVSCVRDAELHLPQLKPEGRSCGAFARWMRTSFPTNPSLTFYCPDPAGAACRLRNSPQTVRMLIS